MQTSGRMIIEYGCCSGACRRRERDGNLGHVHQKFVKNVYIQSRLIIRGWRAITRANGQTPLLNEGCSSLKAQRAIEIKKIL